MPQTSLSGQDLIDLATARLGGYGNYAATDVLMSFLNEAKDEVWAILKNLNADYFIQVSQAVDNSLINYFGPLSSSTRTYTLPADFREMHLFVIGDPAYAQTKFTYKKLTDSDFQEALRSANVDKTLTPTTEYFYTVIGKDQFVMAQYPETTFNLPTLYYVRNLLDFETGDNVDEILLPYSKKIADYAVMRVLLSAQDQEQFEEWRKVWKDDVVMVGTSAGPRNQADAEFVQDFLG